MPSLFNQLFRPKTAAEQKRKKEERRQEEILASLPDAELKPDDCMLREVCVHDPLDGLPAGHGLARIAFDPVQGILAVCTEDGTVRLLGAEGLDSVLHPPAYAPISCLRFVTGRGLLILGSELPALFVWDLRKGTSRHLRECCTTIELTTFPVCIECPLGADFAYIGTSDSKVVFLRLQDMHLAEYVLNSKDMGQEEANESEVVAAAPHPFNIGQILIAFRDAAGLLVWDLKQKKSVKKYASGDRKELQCACWSSDAKFLAAGYKEGDIRIWSAEKEKSPMWNLKTESNGIIRSLIWSTNMESAEGAKEAGYPKLVVAMESSPDVEEKSCEVEIFTGHQWGRQSKLPAESAAKIVDICSGSHARTVGESREYDVFMILERSGAISVVCLKEDGSVLGSSEVRQNLLPGGVTAMHHLCHVPIAIVHSLLLQDTDDALDNRLKMMGVSLGGEIAEPPMTSPAPAFLATAHEGGQLCLWDVRTSTLKLVGSSSKPARGICRNTVSQIQRAPAAGDCHEVQDLKLVVCPAVDGRDLQLLMLIASARDVEVLRLEHSDVSCRTKEEDITAASARKPSLAAAAEGISQDQVVDKVGQIRITHYGEFLEEGIDNCIPESVRNDSKLSQVENDKSRSSPGQEEADFSDEVSYTGDDDGTVDISEQGIALQQGAEQVPAAPEKEKMQTDDTESPERREGMEEMDREESWQEVEADDSAVGEPVEAADAPAQRPPLESQEAQKITVSMVGEKENEKSSEDVSVPHQPSHKSWGRLSCDEIDFKEGFVPLVKAQMTGRIRSITLHKGTGHLILGTHDGFVVFISLYQDSPSAAIHVGIGEASGISALAGGFAGKGDLPMLFVGLDSSSILVLHVPSGARLPMQIPKSHSGEAPVFLAVVDEHGLEPQDSGTVGKISVGSYLVSVSSHSAKVYKLPLGMMNEPPVAHRSLDIVTSSVSLLQHGGEPAVAITDAAGTLVVLSLMRLRPLGQFKLNAALPLLPSNTLQMMAVGSDGRALLTPAGRGDRWVGLMRASLFREENALQLPELGPQFFDSCLRQPEMPDPTKKSAGGGPGLIKSLFKTMTGDVSAASAEDLDKLLASPAMESGLKKLDDPEAAAREQRRQLLAGRRIKQDQEGVTEDQRTKETKAGVGGAHSAAREARDMLVQRGEKLSILQDKSKAMEDKAANFLEMIQEHNKREAAKKWWQI